MARRQTQIRQQLPVSHGSKRSRRLPVLDRREPGTTMQVLAREELREIVRRLAFGERPGIAFEPSSADR